MCVTFCHRRGGVLYWNHEDCYPADCEYATGPHGRCEDCRHRRQAERCALTNAPLPETGGCCHWNVELGQGQQEVTREMLTLLGIGPEDTVEFVLIYLEVPYRRGPQGEVLVDPDELGLPFSAYGLGTEHGSEEVFDWSAWMGQWCSEEI